MGPKVVRRATVQHRHVMPELEQPLDDPTSDELHAADDERPHQANPSAGRATIARARRQSGEPPRGHLG